MFLIELLACSVINFLVIAVEEQVVEEGDGGEERGRQMYTVINL